MKVRNRPRRYHPDPETLEDALRDLDWALTEFRWALADRLRQTFPDARERALGALDDARDAWRRAWAPMDWSGPLTKPWPGQTLGEFLSEVGDRIARIFRALGLDTRPTQGPSPTLRGVLPLNFMEGLATPPEGFQIPVVEDPTSPWGVNVTTFSDDGQTWWTGYRCGHDLTGPTMVEVPETCPRCEEGNRCL